MTEIKLNDKCTVEVKDIRTFYHFLWGYMTAIFETRYTFKFEVGALFYIVTNADGIYSVSAYRVSDEKPLHFNFPEYENIEDVLAILTGYRPRKKVLE